MAKRSKKSEDTVKKIHRLLSILRKLDIRESGMSSDSVISRRKYGHLPWTASGISR